MNFFNRSRPSNPPPQNVNRFLAALAQIAPDAGMGAYGFLKSDGGCHGFVQFLINSPLSVTIHRLWTLKPGQGNGSFMLTRLCELADQFAVEMRLKTVPFGRKPYPFSAADLAAWYQRYGFEPQRRYLTRKPRRKVNA